MHKINHIDGRSNNVFELQKCKNIALPYNTCMKHLTDMHQLATTYAQNCLSLQAKQNHLCDKEFFPICKFLIFPIWLEVVQRDCQVRGLSKDDAMVRGRWRKMIRMVDEQEGCEWMNVSSGTGSPR